MEFDRPAIGVAGKLAFDFFDAFQRFSRVARSDVYRATLSGEVGRAWKADASCCGNIVNAGSPVHERRRGTSASHPVTTATLPLRSSSCSRNFSSAINAMICVRSYAALGSER